MAISLESQSGFNYGYVVAFVSSVLFFINNVCVLSVMIPKSARTTKQKEWKWRNITNSLIHSVITGCGSCLCFWQSPAIREDLVSKSTTPARLLIALSVGTFVVFRILTMGWMTRWLVQHSDDLTVTAYRLAGLTLAVIMVMNIVLLLRILRSDYRQCPKQASEPENIKAR